MIELSHLYKTYPASGVVALEDVSLLVPRGSISGIIGKSGAGKSSLIRCVNFLEQPDRGQVLIDGINLASLSAAKLREKRRKIGMIFQQFNLLSSRTVYDNVALPLKLAGIKKNFIREKVSNLLSLVGLQDKAKAYPAQLSGGQKQRVAIARALANDPEILLCDEATSALDPETTQSILELLKAINQKLGLTILLITHEIEVIKTICAHVTVLEAGRIVEQGSVIDLFTQPKTEITRNLIRPALKFDLPPSIQERLHISKTDHGQVPVLRIEFIGEKTAEPLVSNLSLQYGIKFNILQANLGLVQEQIIGVMLLEVYGDDEQLATGMRYLREQGLQVEVMGYVNNA